MPRSLPFSAYQTIRCFPLQTSTSCVGGKVCLIVASLVALMITLTELVIVHGSGPVAVEGGSGGAAGGGGGGAGAGAGTPACVAHPARIATASSVADSRRFFVIPLVLIHHS